MKVLIVSGSPWSKCQDVFRLLEGCGVAAAKSAERAASVTIAEWHDRAVPEEDRPLTLPGRTLDQVAADIFVANWDQPAWGWADHRSTWLLDYWREFDPDTSFILVSSSPDFALAQAISRTTESPLNLRQVVDRWCRYTQELLSFFHRNRDRSLLVDIADVGIESNSFVSACATRFGLVPPASDFRTQKQNREGFRVTALLAQQILKDFPEAEALRQELHSSVNYFGTIDETCRAPEQIAPQDLDVAIIEVRHLIRAVYEELPRITEPHHSSAQGSPVIDKTDDQNQIAAQTPCAEVPESIQLIAQALTDAKNAIAAREREREEQFRQQQANAQQEFQQQQASAQGAFREKLTATEAAAAKTARERDEQKKENELVVAQLHQVQEELEHYFLLHQETTKTIQQLQRRWDRMLSRNPDYLDWSGLDLLAVESSGSMSALRWRIEGLYVGNRILPAFEFAITTTDGFPALVFFRENTAETATHGLLRWPQEAAGQTEFRLQPVGPETDVRQRMNLIQALATTDYRMSIALCSTLYDVLGRREAARDSALHSSIQYWQEQLSSLHAQLKGLPPHWRYDNVILRRQQLNPDYEHLWFRVENAQFGRRFWNTFEFRLGASLVQADGFSLYPKLEFPRSDDGKQQFENWFAETTDELGPRLELRFALANHAMDLEIFNRLTTDDQLQMIAILLAIPKMLSTLEAQGNKLARPWEDWQRLATGMIETMVRNLATRPSDAETNPVAEIVSPEPPPEQRRTRRTEAKRR